MAGGIIMLPKIQFIPMPSRLTLAAVVFFLPPYSPDLCPIECVWSKIKGVIKKLMPRSPAELHNAFVESIYELNDDDFEEWYAQD